MGLGLISQIDPISRIGPIGLIGPSRLIGALGLIGPSGSVSLVGLPDLLDRPKWRFSMRPNRPDWSDRPYRPIGLIGRLDQPHRPDRLKRPNRPLFSAPSPLHLSSLINSVLSIDQLSQQQQFEAFSMHAAPSRNLKGAVAKKWFGLFLCHDRGFITEVTNGFMAL